MKHDYTILDTPCDEGWTEYTETDKKKDYNLKITSV